MENIKELKKGLAGKFNYCEIYSADPDCYKSRWEWLCGFYDEDNKLAQHLIPVDFRLMDKEEYNNTISHDCEECQYKYIDDNAKILVILVNDNYIMSGKIKNCLARNTIIDKIEERQGELDEETKDNLKVVIDNTLFDIAHGGKMFDKISQIAADHIGIEFIENYKPALANFIFGRFNTNKKASFQRFLDFLDECFEEAGIK